ncbi:unnamed protein product, partial [Staurois parvus]
MCPQSLAISCTVCSLWSSPALSAVSGHPMYCLQSLGHPMYCLQSLGHPLYYPQSLVIPCTVCSLLAIPCSMSAVSGHLLYYVCSLWSSSVLCLQSLVISCTMSAVSG